MTECNHTFAYYREWSDSTFLTYKGFPEFLFMEISEEEWDETFEERLFWKVDDIEWFPYCPCCGVTLPKTQEILEHFNLSISKLQSYFEEEVESLFFEPFTTN